MNTLKSNRLGSPRPKLRLSIVVALIWGCSDDKRTISLDTSSLGNVLGTSFISLFDVSHPWGDLFGALEYTCTSVHEDTKVRCQGHFEDRTTKVHAYGMFDEDERRDACTDSANCQVNADDTTSIDGHFTMSNMLVGDYMFKTQSFYVDFMAEDGGCEASDWDDPDDHYAWQDWEPTTLYDDDVDHYFQLRFKSFDWTQAVGMDTDIELVFTAIKADAVSNPEIICDPL